MTCERVGVQLPAVASRPEGKNQERKELAGECLGGGNTDLWPCMDGQDHVGFACNRALLNVDDGQDPGTLLQVPERGERVGRLAGLADENREGALADGGVAVAELRSHVHLDRDSGERLDPVLCRLAGIERGAAGNHDDSVNLRKVWACIGQEQRAVLDVMPSRIRQDFRLFGDFLGHEVLVAVLFDLARVDPDRANFTVCTSPVCVANFDSGTRNDSAIALLKVADLVCQRAQRNGIGTEIHFTGAKAERERRSPACRDYQVVLAIKQKRQRERAFEACNRLCGRVMRRKTLINMKLRHERNRFGVGLGLGRIAAGGEFLAQFPEVLDDAVVDDRNAPGPVRVGVRHRGRSMRGPAGVPDSGLARQRVVNQHVRKIYELANRSATVQRTVVHCRNSGAVISSVFEALQRLNQGWRRLMVAQDAYDAAHCLIPPCLRHWSRAASPTACGQIPACSSVGPWRPRDPLQERCGL